MSTVDPHDILHCSMGPNDADAATVGEYLGLLLSTLWLQDENFNSKRPFGNSSWQWSVYEALAAAGFAETVINKWGDKDIADVSATDELILQAIRLAYDHGAH